MTVKYGKFEKPKNIRVEDESSENNFARFVAEPFERGFGHTVGNALRRTILNAIEAPAVVSFSIEGIQHEYQAVEGIVEDMTDISLNMKGILLRKYRSEYQQADETHVVSTLIDITQEMIDENNGSYKVRVRDLINDSDYELINPELVIFTVTKPFRRQASFKIMIGRGYVPSEEHDQSSLLADEIVIDSIFSPVRLVNYFVEKTRVGQDTEFDRLVIEVTTDGRISPTEALAFGTQIVLKHFDVFKKLKVPSLQFLESETETDADYGALMDKLCLRIDEIELSVRSTNCLASAHIVTIGDLVTIPEKKMMDYRNFGKKSLLEIKAKLKELGEEIGGLHLGMDLSKYGIRSSNVKEKVSAYLEMRRGEMESKALEEEDEEDEE